MQCQKLTILQVYFYMGAKRDPFFEKKNLTRWNNYALYFKEMEKYNLLNIGFRLMHVVTSSQINF